MKTISQVAQLTGISTRTLQYYDEIGLLRPSDLTPAGYRLYNDEALQRLQQILVFKELDFRLKDIREILQDPHFDKLQAYRQQKELLMKRRQRLDRLIGLLDKLAEGERTTSFKEFDLTDYIETLAQFKKHNTDEVIAYWGSVESFDQFIQSIKDHEPEIARLAVRQFGSVEKYTAVMKNNMEHFSEIMKQA